MDDEKIIEMYFDRNQKAVEETEKKYGRYCFSLAARILANIRKNASMIRGFQRGIPSHRKGRNT